MRFHLPFFAGLALGLVSLGQGSDSSAAPSTQPPAVASAWTPEQETLLRRFAPILVQEVSSDPVRRRWDFPVRVDFDGDRRGANNEESLRFGSRPLEAAVYADLLETGTHLFLTYALFYPLDWSPWPALVPYAWHENDLEVVQVVVRKGAEARGHRVELAAARRHLATAFAAPEGSRVGGWRLARQPLRLLDTTFGPGERAGFRLARGGHEPSFIPRDLSLGNPADTPSARGCLVLVPGDSASEYQAGRRVFAYRLHSLRAAFWTPFLQGQDLGPGKLMDGRFDYRGKRMVREGLPRHLDADRRSAPWKRDAARLPFAFGTGLWAGDAGALFFDPAGRYPEVLRFPEPWSREYAFNPYRE